MFPKHFILFDLIFFYTIFASNSHTWVCPIKFIYRPKKLLKINYQSNEAFSGQVISCLNWCINVTFWAAASESGKKALNWVGGHLSSAQASLPQSRVGPCYLESLSPSLCSHAWSAKASICLSLSQKTTDTLPTGQPILIWVRWYRFITTQVTKCDSQMRGSSLDILSALTRTF